jgi:hypothetical protein
LRVEGEQSHTHVDIINLPKRVVHLARDAFGKMPDAFDPVVERIRIGRACGLDLLVFHIC